METKSLETTLKEKKGLEVTIMRKSSRTVVVLISILNGDWSQIENVLLVGMSRRNGAAIN